MFEDYGDDPTHLDFGKELIFRQAEKSKRGDVSKCWRDHTCEVYSPQRQEF